MVTCSPFRMLLSLRIDVSRSSFACVAPAALLWICLHRLIALALKEKNSTAAAATPMADTGSMLFAFNMPLRCLVRVVVEKMGLSLSRKCYGSG